MIFFNKKGKKRFEHLFQEHSAASVQAASKLIALFATMGADTEAKIAEIVALEHQGDRLTRETYTLLDQSFMTRIDKPDIQRLIHQLDEILDGMHDVAYLIDIYGLVEIRQEAKDIAQVIQSMVSVLAAQLKKMPKLTLLQTQSGHAELNQLETRADEHWRAGVKRAYRELDAKEYAAWRDVFDTLEAVTNRCLSAMSIVDSIVRKEFQ